MFIGIDPSLLNTGVVAVDANGVQFAETHKIDYRKGPKGVERLHVIERWLLAQLPHLEPTLICIEGYAYNAKGLVFEAGELGGVLKLAMWRAGHELLTIPPTVLKRFVTGKGNAPKDAIENWLELTVPDHTAKLSDEHQRDAFVLADLGQLCETGSCLLGRNPTRDAIREAYASAHTVL